MKTLDQEFVLKYNKFYLSVHKDHGHQNYSSQPVGEAWNLTKVIAES